MINPYRDKVAESHKRSTQIKHVLQMKLFFQYITSALSLQITHFLFQKVKKETVKLLVHK